MPSRGFTPVLSFIALLAWPPVATQAQTLKPPTPVAKVVVARAKQACFTDLVRVTGFMVPKREAHVGVDSEGSRVAAVLVREGDSVVNDTELARLTPPPGAQRAVTSLRAPAAGLITSVKTAEGAPASPQAGPMFKIAINGDIELEAEVPGMHMLKLEPGSQARISRDDAPDLAGRVRVVAPELDPQTQLGRVRISLTNTSGIRIGSFARVSIDTRRSCGVSVPRSSVAHASVQVVKGDVIETRKVRLGLRSDTAAEILEGVNEGDLIVADAGTSLHDGDKVSTMFADDIDRSPKR